MLCAIFSAYRDMPSIILFLNVFRSYGFYMSALNRPEKKVIFHLWSYMAFFSGFLDLRDGIRPPAKTRNPLTRLLGE